MSDTAKSPASRDTSESLDVSKPLEMKQNGNRSSESVSPESSISTSRGSTPNLTNTNIDKSKLVDWWRKVALDYASAPALKTENWMQAFQDMDMEEVKDELVEEFQQLLNDELKGLSREQAKQHFERLRSQLVIFEDNKLYEIQKVMTTSDKNIRFEYLSGQFIEQTKHRLREALKQKEQSIFAEGWRKEANDYEEGVITDMNNKLNNEKGRTLEKTMRMFRNTASEMTINKQTNIDVAELNIQSYATNLTSNSEDRKFYLRTTITEYLAEQKQIHDTAMREMMDREIRTLHREMEQLRKTISYGAAGRCCASVCVLL